LCRELEEARETLRGIRSGAFDVLVIDTGSGDELFAMRPGERPHQLVEVMAEGARGQRGRARYLVRARRDARPGDRGNPRHVADRVRVAWLDSERPTRSAIMTPPDGHQVVIASGSTESTGVPRR
jgi:hypothetical protein